MANFLPPPPFDNRCCELIFGVFKSRSRRNILDHRPKSSLLCSIRIGPNQFKGNSVSCKGAGKLNFGKKGDVPSVTPQSLRLCLKRKILTFALHVGIKRCFKPRFYQHSRYLFELILLGNRFLEKGTQLPPLPPWLWHPCVCGFLHC